MDLLGGTVPAVSLYFLNLVIVKVTLPPTPSLSPSPSLQFTVPSLFVPSFPFTSVHCSFIFLSLHFPSLQFTVPSSLLSFTPLHSLSIFNFSCHSYSSLVILLSAPIIHPCQVSDCWLTLRLPAPSLAPLTSNFASSLGVCCGAHRDVQTLAGEQNRTEQSRAEQRCQHEVE